MLRVEFLTHIISNCPSLSELKLKNVFIFIAPKIIFINFYFVKYEPYEKIMNVKLILFTEMYHNILFDFQNFDSSLLL